MIKENYVKSSDSQEIVSKCEQNINFLFKLTLTLANSKIWSCFVVCEIKTGILTALVFVDQKEPSRQPKILKIITPWKYNSRLQKQHFKYLCHIAHCTVAKNAWICLIFAGNGGFWYNWVHCDKMCFIWA